MIAQSVKQWEEEIRLAKAYQAENGRLDRWKENCDFYDNKYPDGVIRVNLIFSIGRGLVPQLYFKTPTILVTPRKPGFRQQAKILEAVDNWLIPHLGIKAQVKLGILDAYRTNIAVFKFGYHSIGSEFPTDRVEEDPVPPSMREAMSGFLEAMKATILPFERQQAGSETEEDKEAQRLRRYSYHDWIKPEAPWMLRIAPEDYLVPFGGLDNPSIPWCAFRVIRPLEDVKKDPVYSHTRSLKANAKLNNTWKDGKVMTPQESSAIPQVDLVELYEVWDKRTGRVKVIVEGHDKFLRNDEHGLDIDGLPSEVLQFNPNGRDFWGVSDVDQIKDQIKEYNETRTVELMHKKTAISKFLFDENSISDDELAKFNEGKIACIKVKGDPRNAVMLLNPSMSRDLYAMSDVIRQDIHEVSGWSRNQLGDFDSDRRTATEAAIVQGALQLRADERRDQVADLIAAAFQRKIHPMIFDYWTEERVIEVTSLGGWQSYTGQQIRGDYEVSAVADSIVPLSRAQRQQTALKAYEILRNDPMFDQYRLRQVLLEQYDDVMPPDVLLPKEQAEQNVLQQAMAQVMSQPKPKPAGGTNAPPRPLVSALSR